MASKHVFLLAGLIVAVFFMQQFILDFTQTYLLTYSEAVERPWTYLTAIFLHADIAHILSNLFALLLFGLILDNVVGGKKFFYLFLGAGIGANLIAVPLVPFIAQQLSQTPSTGALGASGGILGIMGALVVLRPKMVIWVLGVPMPMFIAAFIWAIQNIIGVFAPTGIGNIAHLSGLAIGIIVGLSWRTKTVKIQDKPESNKYFISDAELEAWEQTYMRPRKK